MKKGPMRGRFIPKHPEKYLGNAAKIFGRSSWEFMLFKYLDSTPAVINWASEEIAIPYLSPLDNRVHQYYPDAFAIYRDKYGNIKKEIIEIKPYKETVLTEKSTDRDKVALAVNHAKWKYAAEFAIKQGMSFRVITERVLFPNKLTKRGKK